MAPSGIWKIPLLEGLWSNRNQTTVITKTYFGRGDPMREYRFLDLDFPPS